MALRLLLASVEWGCLVTAGRPFSRLRPAEQRRFLERWRTSPWLPVRLALRTLRALALAPFLWGGPGREDR